ncbi:MAG: N-methyl-L-tryptophan oxidase [Microbacterium sp.]
MDTDVVVIGIGSVGSMALWQLSMQPGLRVLGIEQFGIGHTYGSFSGESRLFRTAVHEGTRYVPLLQASRTLWRELEAECGRRLYIETGALNIGQETDAAMQSVLRTISDFGLAHDLLDEQQLRHRFPQHRASPGMMGVLDHHGGGLRPEASVLGAVSAARRRGATVIENAPVRAIEVVDDGVVLRLDDVTIRARTAIVTTGSWARELQPDLARIIHVTPLALTWFMPEDIGAFTPDRFPVFLRDLDGVHLFGAPTLDGYSVKISGGGRWGRCDSVADVPTELSREDLRRIGAEAADFFPGINPEPVRWSVHHDGGTASRIPVIDRDAAGRIVTAVGLSGHGFKFAPVFGKIAAQLALGVESSYDDPEFSIAAHRAALESELA